MRLALMPLNPIVGDLAGNARLIREAAHAEADRGADLIVLPELALSGYPPRDLLALEGFVERCCDVSRDLASALPAAPTVVFGTPWRPSTDDGAAPDAIDSRARPTNSIVICRGGDIVARYDKRLLPNYDVFDEVRHFARGRSPIVMEIAGKRVAFAICEDIWRAEDALRRGRYARLPDPLDELDALEPDVLIVPSASPFVVGKAEAQRAIIARVAREHAVTLVSLNQFGANDDLIFDGGALVCAPDGVVTARTLPFSAQPLRVDLDTGNAKAASLADPPPMALLWQALVLGVRDYCRKSGFASVLLGLSGGIDSALTACIAVAAMGADNVMTVAMPSRHSSKGSIEDAQALASALGTRHFVAPIEGPHVAFEHSIEPLFAKLGLPQAEGLAEENLQSRIRGTLLMALSNKHGALLLTTGNKSELAVGYTALYGDMNGGLAVLADVLKTEVYALSRYLNEHHAELGFEAPPIPAPTLSKAPSAELRPNQTDQDTLPPYDVLDAIVERYVDLRNSAQHIALETGFDRALVNDIIARIDRNEYKRFQLALGLKVRPSAFGRGRRRAMVERYDHAT